LHTDRSNAPRKYLFLSPRGQSVSTCGSAQRAYLPVARAFLTQTILVPGIVKTCPRSFLGYDAGRVDLITPVPWMRSSIVSSSMGREQSRLC
jgi:hypothetical protein